MIKFNLFVLPFSFGLVFIVYSIVIHYYRWIKALPAVDKVKLASGVRNPSKVLASLKEIFLEGLLHRSLWKRNPLLGYMHMSFALGWFLLIVVGNLESRIYHGSHINAPYYPIFLKFFIHDRLVLFFEIFTVPAFFRFIMDFILLFVLSGLVLAFIKRKKSKWFGMTKTTNHSLYDRITLSCLWLIFPMRLLAESYTAGYFGGGGGFLTQNLGKLLVAITPGSSEMIAYFFWWSYSLVLGLFFILMPNSRYMHIPSEMLLIVFRHCGIQPKKWGSSFSSLEAHSCSRCGVCIDACQLNFAAGITNIQAVYFIRGLREQCVPENIALTCMVCGRCQEACPVGIKVDSLRLIKRREIGSGQVSDFSYLKNGHPGFADVVYFAGCMSHLTPSIPIAMEGIFKEAGVNYLFLDRSGSICCGRPLMLAGKDKQAIGEGRCCKVYRPGSGQRVDVTEREVDYFHCASLFLVDISLAGYPDNFIEHSCIFPSFLIREHLVLNAHVEKLPWRDMFELSFIQNGGGKCRCALPGTCILAPQDHDWRPVGCRLEFITPGARIAFSLGDLNVYPDAFTGGQLFI